MKRSHHAGPAPAAPTPRARSRQSRPQLWLLIGLIALGIGGVAAWRGALPTMLGQTALPARPSLAGQPAIFGELLASAESKAMVAATRWEGMRDLGGLYHANNFPAEAAACWNILRAADRREARWCYYLADLSRATSDYSAMIALLEETLRLAPDYSPARLVLANLQLKTGARAAARTNFELRLAALPRDPYARLGLVRLALQDGRQDEARSLLARLLQDAPNFSTAHNLYAELLAAAGDAAGASRHRWLGRETLRYRDAEDPWLDELRDRCCNYERLCTFGSAEMQAEQGDRAQIILQRAIELRPADSQAYELLGVLYLQRRDTLKAVALFEQALPRLTGKVSAVFFASFSQALRLANRPTEAVEIVRRGLERIGSSPELLDALGLALANVGRHEEAVTAWEAALARNPGDAAENYNLALSLLALRWLDDALAALDRSLTLQPTFLPTLLLRGQIELEAGHMELAERYVRPAFESHPEDAQARRLLADWHRQMAAAAEGKGDSAAAEQDYRDGLAVAADHPELLLALGTFLFKRERYADAIIPLVALHHLQPENARGCLVLGQAYAATGLSAQAREILQFGARLSLQAGDRATADRCRILLDQL